MRRGSISATVGFAMLILPAAVRNASAHHAFAAEYDANRRVILKGSVTKVEWQNPHAHLAITVQDAGGKASTWELELASPSTLQREGWTRNTVRVGDTVTVDGYLAKDGSNLAHARDIRLADGRKVLAGALPDGPTQ